MMDEELLTTKDAARRLGMARSSLYELLAQSNAGTLVIRGQPIIVAYYQGGARGEGRIRIRESEVRRLLSAMQVTPTEVPRRQAPLPRPVLNHITVPLGRPQD